jgi:regulatory protein
MIITGLSSQQKNSDRINVMVDGAYRFSLDIFQVADLGIRIGKEYSEEELVQLEEESQFGKLYARALEYCLMRPHSSREVRDYLYRKTRTTKVKNRKTGELRERAGVSQPIAERVYERLIEKGYLSDEKFARFWVENRNLQKGMSRRKLSAELMSKGVGREIIEATLAEYGRDDEDELAKTIAKKARRYSDKQKFMAYLVGQGYSYDDVKTALANFGTDQ